MPQTTPGSANLHIIKLIKKDTNLGLIIIDKQHSPTLTKMQRLVQEITQLCIILSSETS